MALTEVVITVTRKTLKIVCLDEDDNPINLNGAQSLRLQGTSPDLPGVTMDQAGAIYDGPSGIAQWTQVGTFVTSGQLGSKPSATFNLRVKLIDSTGKLDYGPVFQFTWFPTPI
jgi:hypothetical protein